MIVAADRDAMYTVSEELKQIDNDLKRIQFAIEQLIFSTYADWQGDSERAFAEKIIVINEKYHDLHAFVDYYSKLLKRFADSYQMMDEETAKRIKSI